VHVQMMKQAGGTEMLASKEELENARIEKNNDQVDKGVVQSLIDMLVGSLPKPKRRRLNSGCPGER
jgi:hypothetical protein